MLVSAKLQDQLLAAQRSEIAAHHDLHTRHLLPDGTPKYVNRLILSSSPYLRQHAHNPVQWFPWGDEAFNLARKLHRPVFLSVGYATCHWCHVMADESFEDEQIARYLNDHFISIKIDREQRPDLDSHFMKAVQQMLNGRGGWPMSVWLTPDREPFFARTYVPARDGDRGIPTGFLSLLERIATHYEKDPKSVMMTAKHFGAALRDLPPVISTPAQLDAQKTIDSAIKVASWLYDNVHGGPKGAPKFPSTFPSRLLLRQSTFGDPDHTLLTMAERTLDGMADGGLRDQLGGGFHRYSVDDRWHVPHFEKMLYDNAQLAVTYLEAVQVTGNQRYASVARGVLDDVLREMTAPSGGFCSALDADSLDPAGHKVEGWFYTWTPKELADVLGPKQGRAMAELFGVTTAGDVDGRSVLRRAQSESVVAQIAGVELSEAPKLVGASIEQLRKARENRPKPQRDDKVLTSWNGLMIEALALGSRVLGDERYRRAAEKAAAVVLADRSPDGRLAHSRLGANVERMDFIDDYAMLASGLLALFQATSDIRWLKGAISLEKTVREHFWDEQRHLFRLVAKERQDIAGAQYPVQDGPVPSGNAMMAWVELQLEALTENKAYGELADKLMGALSKSASRSPHGHTDLMLAVQLRARPMKQVVVVRADKSTGESELTRVVWSTLAPGAVKVVASEGQVDGALGEALPWMKGKTAKEGKDTAYVCTNRGCKAPTTEGKVLGKQLK